MAMCRPKAAMLIAICTAFYSPHSGRKRAIPPCFFRKNHTSKIKALPHANICFDNAARIADNFRCEILHSSKMDIKPSVAEMRNYGKQIRKMVYAKTFFFSPMWSMAAACRVEVSPETGLLRVLQMAYKGFARAVTGWAWRGETLILSGIVEV